MFQFSSCKLFPVSQHRLHLFHPAGHAVLGANVTGPIKSNPPSEVQIIRATWSFTEINFTDLFYF